MVHKSSKLNDFFPRQHVTLLRRIIYDGLGTSLLINYVTSVPRKWPTANKHEVHNVDDEEKENRKDIMSRIRLK